MSQINDALKRARNAQNDKPGNAAATPKAVPVKPAPPTPEPPKSEGSIGALLTACAAIVVTLFLGWYAVGKSKPATATEAPKQATPAKPAQAVAATTPAKTEITNAPMAQLPPAKPALKLQAIMYDPQRPVALVSGNSVMIGDKVGGYKVRAITSESVILVSATETNVLTVQVRL